MVDLNQVPRNAAELQALTNEVVRLLSIGPDAVGSAPINQWYATAPGRNRNSAAGGYSFDPGITRDQLAANHQALMFLVKKYGNVSKTPTVTNSVTPAVAPVPQPVPQASAAPVSQPVTPVPTSQVEDPAVIEPDPVDMGMGEELVVEQQTPPAQPEQPIQQSTTQQQPAQSTAQVKAEPGGQVRFGLDLGMNPIVGQAPGSDALRQQQQGLVEQAASQQGAATEATAYAHHKYAPTILAQAGEAARQAALRNSGNVGAGAAALAGLQSATDAQQQALPGATQQDIQREQHWNEQAYQRGQAARDTGKMALGTQREREQLERLFQNHQAYNRSVSALQDEGNAAAKGAGSNTSAFAKRDPSGNVNNAQTAVDNAEAATGSTVTPSLGEMPKHQSMTSAQLDEKLRNLSATEKDIDIWGTANNQSPMVVDLAKKWLNYVKHEKAAGNKEVIEGELTDSILAYAKQLKAPPSPSPRAARQAAGRNTANETQAPMNQPPPLNPGATSTNNIRGGV